MRTALLALLLFVGCKNEPRASPQDEPLETPTPFFDPARYATHCAVDADCVLRGGYSASCTTCCPKTAIREADSRADYEKLVADCKATVGYVGDCGLSCSGDTAACREGQCVRVSSSPPFNPNAPPGATLPDGGPLP